MKVIKIGEKKSLKVFICGGNCAVCIKKTCNISQYKFCKGEMSCKNNHN